ncbi:hypothetical protein WJ63_29550 [Burkholderia pyrrocinia]|nr:hypothetical protein WJ63_29550 [Burkholderia pyrrocinia]
MHRGRPRREATHPRANAADVANGANVVEAVRRARSRFAPAAASSHACGAPARQRPTIGASLP